MPYAPVLDSRAGDYIMAGAKQASQAIGQGIAAMRKTAQEEDYLQGWAQLGLKDKPDLMKKFLEGGVGVKRGIMAGEQAEQAAQFKTADIAADYYRTDSRINQATDDRRFQMDMMREKQKGSIPVPVDLQGGEQGYRVPMTGQIIREKKALPAPDGLAEIPVYDGPGNTGNIVAKRMWDPIKGAYDTVDVRARSNSLDTLAAALGGGAGGQAGSQAPATPTPQKPSAPATPKITSKAEYDKLPAGSQFIGPDGGMYRKK